MRNDFCLGASAPSGSGNRFTSTSRLPVISSGAFLASLAFAVALGASGAAHAACGGSASTGVKPATVSTGVHVATSTPSAGGTGVVSHSSCPSMSNRTITADVAGRVGPTGAIEPHPHTHRGEWTNTNTATTNTATRNTTTRNTTTRNTTINASNWHGNWHKPKT